MKKILFCGTYLPEDISEQIKHNSVAANNFQGSIIRNLKENHNMEILTYVGYREEKISQLEKSLNENKFHYVIKQMRKNYFHIIKNYYKIFKNLIKKNDVVMLYNYNYINLLVNYYSKKNKVKTVLIVADHDEPREHRNIIRKMLAYKYSKDYSKFDKLIFLSKNLQSRYRDNDSILLLGGINNEKYENFNPNKATSKIRILYSGVLSKVTGIDLLLEAINKISNNNVEFIFTGKGEMDNKIKDCTREDSRIKYYGFLSSGEFIKLLDSSHILINPRDMNLPQNDNNFPSKILEYLATGRLIISTKFPGYEDFVDNIFFCEANEDSIASVINETVNNYEKQYVDIYNENRKKATEFDWKQQVKKIENIIGE